MIKDAENKSIPGPRLERRFLSPSAPSAERFVCETCQRQAEAHGDLVHSRDCAWAIQHKARRIGVDNLP